jgi:hypothetical protein
MSVSLPVQRAWLTVNPTGMTVMTRHLPVLLPIALLASLTVGCGSASTSLDGWDYSGPDATLKSPFPMSAERRRQILEDHESKQSGILSEALQKKLGEDDEAWKRKYAEAVQGARDACIRESGDSGTRSFLTGYNQGFLTCMNAHGWSRSRLSNPA